MKKYIVCSYFWYVKGRYYVFWLENDSETIGRAIMDFDFDRVEECDEIGFYEISELSEKEWEDIQWNAVVSVQKSLCGKTSDMLPIFNYRLAEKVFTNLEESKFDEVCEEEWGGDSKPWIDRSNFR